RDEEVLFADISIEELEQLPVSVEDFAVEDGRYLVYPNPVADRLFFVENVLEEFEEVLVYDVKGDLILSEALGSDGLDMSGLESGLYFVVLEGKEDLRKGFRVVRK
ncbi:MAG: T9SS type A sorting domain-containing protein, partial [Chitinophagales bacterium]